DREARLDHVDAQPCELVGDLELLLAVQGDSGRLLAVAQSRVEDPDAVRLVALLLCAHAARSPSRLAPAFVSGWSAATRPPRAIPPEGGGEGGAEARM